MKKLISLLILPILIFSFALADPEIGTLEWELVYMSGNLRDAELVTYTVDDSDPDRVAMDMTFTYTMGGVDWAVASRLLWNSKFLLGHAQTYPECARVTLRWQPAGEGRPSVMTFDVERDGYTLVEASGLILVLVMEYK